MGGVHSGMHGVAEGIGTVRNWSINEVTTLIKYGASNTRGGAGRVVGVADWNGSFEQLSGAGSIMPGDSISFVGFTAPDTDVWDASGEKYSGTAICDSLTVSWDWMTGEIVSSQVAFSGNGALTNSQAVPTPDATVPDPDGSLVALAPNWNAVNIVAAAQATLTITAANQAYANADTSGWMARKAGPVDWTAAITVHETGRQSLTKGDIAILKLFVDATDYWNLKWGMIRDFSGIVVDAQTGAIIQQTINIDMCGFNAAAGQIFQPGELITPWWPF